MTRVLAVFAATVVFAALAGLRADAANYGGVPEAVKRRVRAEVHRQFPASEWRWVLCVIGRESGWNPRAVNWSDPNGGSHGLMQINGAHRRFIGETLWAQRYTVTGGIRMGARLWRYSGRGPWLGGGYSC